MRVIATATRKKWGLVEDEEFISSDEEKKEIYEKFGWVKPYDDTEPLPPIGIAVDYEDGMKYPKNRPIIKEGNIYQSNTDTSTTWIHSIIPGEPSEWDIKVRGLPLVPPQ